VAVHAPYREAAANDVYNLLFCDEPRMFAPHDGKGGDWQRTLFGGSPSSEDVRKLADDASLDARVRMLACNWLREHSQPLPPKELFGVVVEVPLDGGLDTLAAYLDGGVRYINQSGKMSIFEGPIAKLAPFVDKLFAASRAVVARIGPWDKARLPAPRRGHVRLSFLVSDGLYFGEGPMEVFSRDAMAGPVIQAASQLLQEVVDFSLSKGKQ
jgi:hypothetical protein